MLYDFYVHDSVFLQDASSSEIRKAYRKLSLTLHPDKNKDENAENQFRQVGVLSLNESSLWVHVDCINCCFYSLPFEIQCITIELSSLSSLTS